MKWTDSAPANIALIKYMGKRDSKKNLPHNVSFSYTLNHLQTIVEIEESNLKEDAWEPLPQINHETLSLSLDGQQRFLDHLTFLKKIYNYSGHFIVRSCNNFPSDCGLASSASSYAALTKCALKALCDLTEQPLPSIEKQAMLSRQASGSSCRSFYSPWCLWQDEMIEKVQLPYDSLLHQVVIISQEKKPISSSEAHELVTTSPLFDDRSGRSQQRLQRLLLALSEKQWKDAFIITWQEFWDMHALFETCSQPFGYMTSETVKVLAIVKQYWYQHQTGPLITLDAGPNIHLLYQPEQHQDAANIKKLLHPFRIIESE